MSRDEGFAVADVSTRLPYDVRLVRAIRQAGPGAGFAWVAVVLASWEAGEPVHFRDAVDTLPYELGDLDAIEAALEAHGLLDAGVIRADSWSSWYGTAAGRRDQKRARDREYAAARRGSRPVVNESSPTRRESRPPTVPSVPTDPSAPTPRVGSTLRDALTTMGMLPEVVK